MFYANCNTYLELYCKQNWSYFNILYKTRNLGNTNQKGEQEILNTLKMLKLFSIIKKKKKLTKTYSKSSYLKTNVPSQPLPKIRFELNNIFPTFVKPLGNSSVIAVTVPIPKFFCEKPLLDDCLKSRTWNNHVIIIQSFYCLAPKLRATDSEKNFYSRC